MDEKKILLRLPLSGREFPVILRESHRAKRLTLYFKRDHGLLVIPSGYPEESARIFLLNHRLWLEGMLRKKELLPERVPLLPTYVERLHFEAFSETWQVLYRFRKSGKIQSFFPENGRTLLLSGEVLEQEMVKKALKEFLISAGERLLPEYLQAVSREVALPCSSCKVKFQKSRWGCCNSRKEITLNAALLLVPEMCLKYVVLHELCHTLAMDHSANFYAHLEKYMPDYELYREKLKKVLLPDW